jgi:GT2 family glycosyltransferase
MESEPNKPSIASVTIAHNSGATLIRQIEALKGQTYPLSEIVIVDNASVDNTGTLLEEKYPEITLLKMEKNIGAAGAWAVGLKHCISKGHDWFWTFDDDSLPELNTLEILQEGVCERCDRGPEVAMAVPLPVNQASGAVYPPWLWREAFVRPTAQQIQSPFWFADLAIASGSLIRREVVEEIGLPRADFFMDIFDLEYCLRIRKAGYKIAVISQAKLEHEIGNARKIRLPFYSRTWTDQPPWREYYISRNLSYLAWHLYPSRSSKCSVARYLIEHILGVSLFSSKKFACLKRIIQGFRDGLCSRLGSRFLPGEQAVEAVRVGATENT